jgi:DNA-binding transcriptional MerR regulator
VLRFWESRFPQIRPVKRAGGRRYYRPNDVALLTGIKFLLHAEGMTIRGAQKMLRDQGVRHVAGLGGAEIVGVDDDAEAALTAALSTNFGIAPPKPERAQPERAETATVVALETALRRSDARKAAPPPPSSRAEVTALDRSASLENAALGETPPLPGLDLAEPAPAPDLPTPAAQNNAAGHSVPVSLTDALRALPSAALAASPAARTLLARARILHARLLQKPNTAGI